MDKKRLKYHNIRTTDSDSDRHLFTKKSKTNFNTLTAPSNLFTPLLLRKAFSCLRMNITFHYDGVLIYDPG